MILYTCSWTFSKKNGKLQKQFCARTKIAVRIVTPLLRTVQYRLQFYRFSLVVMTWLRHRVEFLRVHPCHSTTMWSLTNDKDCTYKPALPQYYIFFIPFRLKQHFPSRWPDTLTVLQSDPASHRYPISNRSIKLLTSLHPHNMPPRGKSVPVAKKKVVETISPPEKTVRKKKRTESYASYIYKVLKQVHPETGVSTKAMSIMNSFVNDLFDRLATEAEKLASYNNVKTLTSREIQTAVRLLLPGELAKHAVSEGTKAVTKFSSSWAVWFVASPKTKGWLWCPPHCKLNFLVMCC